MPFLASLTTNDGMEIDYEGYHPVLAEPGGSNGSIWLEAKFPRTPNGIMDGANVVLTVSTFGRCDIPFRNLPGSPSDFLDGMVFAWKAIAPVAAGERPCAVFRFP